MPIYEYACPHCGHHLEALQKLTDPALKTCPACGAESLVKKVSAAGFQLKGSGWYATDFRSSGTKPATADAAKPAETSDDGKSESAKPAGVGKSESAKPAGDAPSEGKSETKSAAAGCGGSCACH